MRDVVVIGAGPGGLFAARELAAHGHDVLVLEEHESIGSPVHCTGVIGAEAFTELDLSREAVCAVSQSARFHAPSGQTVVVESERVQAAVLDRCEFDRVLAREAARVGTSIWTQAKVERLHIDDTEVTLHVANREQPVRSRACVLACGANYRFNRQLGLGLPRSFVQTAQMEVAFPPLAHIEVFLGCRLAKGGFGWIVPFTRAGQSHARIGLMCDGAVADRFATFARMIGNQWGVDHETWPAPRLRALPLGPVAKTHGTRLLAVGDAAGLVKPTTGGGIYYGLLSGRFAANVLGAALLRDTLDERSLRPYEAQWRARLGPDLRAGLAFRAIASRLTDPAIEALFDLAQVNALVPLLKEHSNFNWHRTAALALLRHAAFRRIVLNAARSPSPCA